MPEKNSNPQSKPASSVIDNSAESASYPFYVWSGLLTPHHRNEMGIAVWVYLWCLRRTTREVDGIGLVLGGTPIKTGRIADELGVTPRSVSTDLAHLRRCGYLATKRVPYGLIITVAKSKRKLKRSEDSFVSQIGRKLPISPLRSEENGSGDRKDSSDVIKSKQLSKQVKRENSGSASPHRKAAPAPKRNSEKPKDYTVEVSYV